jgi:carbonic anhydrase/acetyltransferase-like protein (isoleucine patch superfamily)
MEIMLSAGGDIMLNRIKTLARKLRERYIVAQLRRAGCRVSSDVRLIGTSDFGDAPYLLTIGRHVTITASCAFETHLPIEDLIRKLAGRDAIAYGPIAIHDNSFIGTSAMIAPGVTIGPNSIVGAGSVVFEDVPPNTVVAGNPARVICTLEEYAEKRLAQTPDYDVAAYFRNPRAVVEALYLHNSAKPAQE